MSGEPNCSQCGEHLLGDVPQGLCQKCRAELDLLTNNKKDEENPSGNQDSDTTTVASTREGISLELEHLKKDLPHLEFQERLGEGGTGVVYKAKDNNLDRLTAVKILPLRTSREEDAFTQRFHQEAVALANLNHPQIVTVYDYGRTERGYHYILMEYVDGKSLKQVIRDHRLSSPEAVDIIYQVCEALAYAHENGIIHRDIKPENILVDSDGRVKILDFGLARLVKYPLRLQTKPQQQLGTRYYMAPEQINNQDAISGQADIYSLGVVFYEMLTGELPIGNYDKPSEKLPVDERLDGVIDTMLRTSLQRRYGKVRDVINALDKIKMTPGWNCFWTYPLACTKDRTFGLYTEDGHQIWPLTLEQYREILGTEPMTPEHRLSMCRLAARLQSEPALKNIEMAKVLEETSLPDSLKSELGEVSPNSELLGHAAKPDFVNIGLCPDGGYDAAMLQSWDDMRKTAIGILEEYHLSPYTLVLSCYQSGIMTITTQNLSKTDLLPLIDTPVIGSITDGSVKFYGVEGGKQPSSATITHWTAHKILSESDGESDTVIIHCCPQLLSDLLASYSDAQLRDVLKPHVLLENETSGTKKLGEQVGVVLKRYPSVIARKHGVWTCGSTFIMAREKLTDVIRDVGAVPQSANSFQEALVSQIRPRPVPR